MGLILGTAGNLWAEIRMPMELGHCTRGMVHLQQQWRKQMNKILLVLLSFAN